MSDIFNNFLNEMSDLAKGKGKKSGDVNFTVRRGTDIELASHIPYGVPSRIPQLDLTLGRPGYPAGRIVELYGFEASGKTTAALAAVASAQKKGGFCLWIDAEFSFSELWARNNGCDPERMTVAEADSIEGILNVQEKAIQSYAKVKEDGAPFVVVVDSITALPSLESLEKDFGDVQRLGTDARAIRNGMRKLTKDIAESNTLAIYINHNIAKTTATPFAKQSTSAGGHALKFYSSLRIEFAKGSNIYDSKDEDKKRRGMEVFITVEKNKVMSTGRPKIKTALTENGFDLYEGLFEALLEIEEIKQESNSYLLVEQGTKLSRKEWKTFVDEYATGIDDAYAFFLNKATKKGFILPYS